MASISVLGGGVNGVTTGLLLRLFGHDVTLYTRRRADHAHGTHDPVMASLYPAASVIPHAVTVDDPAKHLADAQAMFDVLRSTGGFGVRKQLHFEAYESPEADPPYAAALDGFRRLRHSNLQPPRRRGADDVYGWHFDLYFAEAPVYFDALFAAFEQLGGRIEHREITRSTLHELPGDAFVNALGGEAPNIFPDPAPAQYLLGILIFAASPGLPRHTGTGRRVSYNYTPASDVYAAADGSPAGVYAYPRRDVWVLGGTKQPGHIAADGTWNGEPMDGELVELPLAGVPDQTVGVPRPIIDLNRQLLSDLTGHSLLMSGLEATYGIRYARDLDGAGVRFCLDNTPDGRPVAHNTGHGGAGVTLSWSSALRVLRILQDAGITTSPLSSHPELPHLFQRLRDTALHLLRRSGVNDEAQTSASGSS
ncbi:hypothetical protein CRI94_12075 [Longibacter salinarum]|uniref:D-amino-acid oxidase n=1 Tax=Longibacter salinarum TaxID=1850348 RepID=A0A2A8CVV8_9BACT|nr:FAD-dependent oxidoreductase [Longibacter salinarum]PEN12753.1 hypothetical protein CRI94_12075 [Longibacter salinarum]